MPRPSALNLGLLVIGLMSLALGPAGAVVRYVDPTAPGPEHDGIAWQTAFQAIGPALAASSAGDEVRVATGGYGESVTLKEGVALLGGFRGARDPESARDPKAHPSTLLGGGPGPAVSAPVGLTAAAVLDGFTLQTEASSAVYCASASPTISNNVFDQVAIGVNCGAGGAPKIVNCVFQQCDTGVFALDTNLTLSGCLFIANDTGARLGNSSGSLVNNTVAWCASAIVLVNSRPVVANNILALNDTGLRADGAGPDVHHNLVYANAADYAGLDDPTGRNGNLRADPLFVNAEMDDYHLRPGSPAINAGNDAAVVGSRDLDGNDRIRDARVDIGAYEYAAPLPANPAEALRRAGGLTAASPADFPAYDPETAPPSTGLIDILDALRIVRSKQ